MVRVLISAMEEEMRERRKRRRICKGSFAILGEFTAVVMTVGVVVTAGWTETKLEEVNE